MTVLRVGLKGGPTSGNRGHAGRPGHLGGSVARGVVAGGGDTLEATNVGKFVGHGELDKPNTPFSHDGMKLLGLTDDYGDGSINEKQVLGTEAGFYKNRLVTQLSEDTGIPYNDVNRFVHQWAGSSNDTDMRSMSIQKAVADEFGVPLSPWQKQRIYDLKHAETELPKVDKQLEAGQQRYNELTSQMQHTNYAKNSIISTADPRYEQLYKQWESLNKERNAVEAKNNALYERRSTLTSIKYKSDYERQHIFAHSDTKDPEGDARRLVRAMYNRQQAAFKEAGITSLTLFRGVRVGHSNQGKVQAGGVIGLLSNAAESWSASSSTARAFGHGTGGVILASKVPVSRILTSALTGFGCLEEKEYVVMSSKSAHADRAYVMYSH